MTSTTHAEAEAALTHHAADLNEPSNQAERVVLCHAAGARPTHQSMHTVSSLRCHRAHDAGSADPTQR